MRVIAAILSMLLVAAATISAQSSDSGNVHKKKSRAASTATRAQRTHETAAPSSSDLRVGTTKSGHVVFRGKKGGYYVLTPSGRKRYVKESHIIFDEKK